MNGASVQSGGSGFGGEAMKSSVAKAQFTFPCRVHSSRHGGGRGLEWLFLSGHDGRGLRWDSQFLAREDGAVRTLDTIGCHQIREPDIQALGNRFQRVARLNEHGVG